MNCAACISKCKADCCRGPIPMEAALLQLHPVARPITMQQELAPGIVVVVNVDPVTRMASCPFLGMDNKCTIYNDRPEVCRTFGTEVDIKMTCSYQAWDGRIRGRQERRHIERQQEKASGQSIRRILSTMQQL